MATANAFINEEFAALLRPLSAEEFAELEASCVKHGIREPLIVNEKGEILDGVHRFRIAKKHNLPFDIRVHAGLTEEETITWIRLNQVGRRNCTEEEIAYQRGKLYESKKAKNVGFSHGVQNQPRGRTSEIIAKETGVSPDTVKRDAARTKLLDSLPANIKNAYLGGHLKASDEQLKTLSALPSETVQEVCRQVRVGERTMSQALAEHKVAEPEPEKQKTLQEWLLPMASSIDKMRQRTDLIVDEFGPSPFAKSWLKYSDLAVMELKKWMKAK